MNIIRTTKSLCPVCARESAGGVVLRDGKVLLRRECPDHGAHELTLSHHAELYADLDRYYFTVLKGQQTSGRITNYWFLIQNTCQMNCSYCAVELDTPFYESMSVEQYRNIIKQYRKTKHTFSGGEPTLHPQLFEFIAEAVREGVTVQLATNAVALADKAYCERLKALGVDEFRVSMESFDPEQAAQLGLDMFLEAKLKALENLEFLNLPVSLSPTLFRGINENQLVAACEYAKSRFFIRSLSVNGFSWVTSFTRYTPDHILMPDEMMDLLHERYCAGPREEIFTFQKAIHSILHLTNIRLCMNGQIFLMVRENDTLTPITDFLAMGRMKNALKWWERFARSNIWVRRVTFAGVLARSIRFKTLRLLPAMTKLFLVNLFDINIRTYPTVFLPVIFNTNCNVYNADKTLSKQCMSGNLYMRHGALCETYSTKTLWDKEQRRHCACGKNASETVDNDRV